MKKTSFIVIFCLLAGLALPAGVFAYPYKGSSNFSSSASSSASARELTKAALPPLAVRVVNAVSDQTGILEGGFASVGAAASGHGACSFAEFSESLTGGAGAIDLNQSPRCFRLVSFSPSPAPSLAVVQLPEFTGRVSVAPLKASAVSSSALEPFLPSQDSALPIASVAAITAACYESCKFLKKRIKKISSRIRENIFAAALVLRC